MTDQINPAMAPPADIAPRLSREADDFSGPLVAILTGACDPILINPIRDWIEVAFESRAKNSLNAFLADLRAMAPLFQANRLLLVPARPAALSQYIDKIATGLVPMKASTIARRMASVALLHRAAGLPSPTRSQMVRDALNRHKRATGTITRQAMPLRTADVKKMLTCIGTTAVDLRDRALILLAHDTGMRASELLGIRVDQFQKTDQGRGLILLERPKPGASRQQLTLPISKTAAGAIEDWVEAIAMRQGPLFRGFDLAGNLRDGALSRQSYDRIIKFRASAIGLGQGISAHSSRIGFAQDLLEKGASPLAVMRAGRWKSPAMVLHYGEQIDPEQTVTI